jgi:hypothetical protein
MSACCLSLSSDAWPKGLALHEAQFSLVLVPSTWYLVPSTLS